MSRTTIRPAESRTKPSTRQRTLFWVLGAVVVVGVVVGLYAIFSTSASSTTSASGTTYAIGQPGPGQPAPAFTLADTTGKQVSLADYHGKTVLLYFQEGLSCQPCWDQITSLEADSTKVKAAGIDAIVSITSDPANLIVQKTSDMGLTTPVLSDPDLAVSQKYEANQYGMMGTSRDGHSFILVDPDGRITWRADYGGAPNYTMFVPVDQLLSDLQHGAKP